MKKIMLLAVALVVLSAGSAFAWDTYGYIGLFANEEYNTWCVWGTGMYPAEMWVWCISNYELGTICSEFSVCYPANVIQSTVTWNDPIISVSLGDLANGLSVCYVDCQWGWFWIAHQTLWVTDATKTRCEICPHPDVGVYQFANCSPGYPTEPCTKGYDLLVNYPPNDPNCTVATESASWGAIKSMIE